MSVRVRVFICTPDGQLSRLKAGRMDGLIFGEEGLIDYAGLRLPVVEVAIEYLNRVPTRIMRISGYYWEFDGDGKIAAYLRNQAYIKMSKAFSSPLLNNSRMSDTGSKPDDWLVPVSTINLVCKLLRFSVISTH